MRAPAWLTRTPIAAAVLGGVVTAALIAPLLLRPANPVVAADEQRRVAYEATITSCLTLAEQISKAHTTSAAGHLQAQSSALDCKAVRKAAQR
jgi:hypothetical protein